MRPSVCLDLVRLHHRSACADGKSSGCASILSPSKDNCEALKPAACRAVVLVFDELMTPQPSYFRHQTRRKNVGHPFASNPFGSTLRYAAVTKGYAGCRCRFAQSVNMQASYHSAYRWAQAQVLWVINCGACGAPDYNLQGEDLCLCKDPVTKIIGLLK